MTPLISIRQQGTKIYTVDSVGRPEFVARCPDVNVAGWVAWSLAEQHGVEHLVYPAEDGSPGAEPSYEELAEELAKRERVQMTVQGPADDPVMKDVLSLLRRRAPDAEVEGVNAGMRDLLDQRVLSRELRREREHARAAQGTEGAGKPKAE